MTIGIEEALEFLFTHKVTHLLMEFEDIFGISKLMGNGKMLFHYLRADNSGLHFSTNFNIPVKSVDLNLDASGKPTSADINGKKVKLNPKLTSAAKQMYLFSDDSLKGCVAVTPMQISNEQKESRREKRWNVIYLNEIAKNSLAIKLHFFEEKSPHFRLVYPTESKVTQNKPITNEIKIWEINYPNGIKENPDYLLIKPPNPGR
jgi:hypothetical protein